MNHGESNTKKHITSIILCIISLTLICSYFSLLQEYKDEKRHRHQLEKYIKNMEDFVCQEQDEINIHLRKLEDIVYKNRRR